MNIAMYCLVNPRIPASRIRTHLFVDKNCWENWITVWQKLGIYQCLTPYTRIKFKWAHDLGIKTDTVNKLGEQGIVHLSDLWRMEKFITKH